MHASSFLFYIKDFLKMYKVGKKMIKIITGRLLSINFGLCPF